MATQYTRIVTEYRTSLDALRLNDDIRALDEARKHLEAVDPANITEDKEFGWDIIRLLQNELRTCQRYAENKLRKEYLAPTKKKIQRNPNPKV